MSLVVIADEVWESGQGFDRVRGRVTRSGVDGTPGVQRQDVNQYEGLGGVSKCPLLSHSRSELDTVSHPYMESHLVKWNWRRSPSSPVGARIFVPERSRVY